MALTKDEKAKIVKEFAKMRKILVLQKYKSLFLLKKSTI